MDDEKRYRGVYHDHQGACDGSRATIDTLILIPLEVYGPKQIKGLDWLKSLQFRRYLN